SISSITVIALIFRSGRWRCIETSRSPGPLIDVNVVGIVCALAAQGPHLGPAARGHERVSSLADGTLLIVSRMGSPAAALGARALIDAGASALASWGMAGGLDPALAAGTI